MHPIIHQKEYISLHVNEKKKKKKKKRRGSFTIKPSSSFNLYRIKRGNKVKFYIKKKESIIISLTKHRIHGAYKLCLKIVLLKKK